MVGARLYQVGLGWVFGQVGVGVGGSWGSIDSDGGILSKNSWRRPQLQITPSYSCLGHQRRGGERETRYFDLRFSHIGISVKFDSLILGFVDILIIGHSGC